MKPYIAAYLRLSLDDDGPGESNSIISQRQIVKDHISSMPDLAGMSVMEFVDDGYSGTNFDRPGVKRLLAAARRGEIRCIIVKDFSRFGRKYLEVSKYIEQLFPYLGIRFISVNDRYDSDSHKGTSAEIDVPVRNMINAMYSKDISKKIKSAKRTQAAQGKFINAFAPYGYKKDGADKHRIVIDEPAAGIVRRIFALACEGHGPTRIANALNADGVPTPSGYKKTRGSHIAVRASARSSWLSGSVINILRDERYTGVFIGGKAEMGELGTGRRIRKPKESWLRVPDAHPAIITREIWDSAVANRGRHDGKHVKPNTGKMLYQRVRCGYCGHIMKHKKYGQYSYYNCHTPRYTDEYGCPRKGFRDESIIDTVKAAVQSQVTFMLDMERLCDKKEAVQNAESTQASAKRLEKEIEQLQTFKRQLYERYKDGTLDREEYLKEREAAESDMAAKTEERATLLTQCGKKAEALNSAHHYFRSFLEYQAVTEPSAEMVNKLVEAVSVYGKNRIEIRFTFRDELERAVKCLEEVRAL